MIDTRKYKTLWLCLLMGNLSILPTSGHANPALTGADLFEVCVSRLTIPETPCLAFISGVTAGHALSVSTGRTFYRLPDNADITQAKHIIVKYL